MEYDKNLISEWIESELQRIMKNGKLSEGEKEYYGALRIVRLGIKLEI